MALRWKNYRMRMTFTTPLCGGVPRNDKLVREWAERRAATPAAYAKLKKEPPGPEETAKQPKNIGAVMDEKSETVDTLPEGTDAQMEKVWVGFSRDKNGLFIRGANVRAHLKDCAGVIGQEMKAEKDPLTNFRSKVISRLYVKEDRLYPTDKKGQIFKEASGNRDAALTVMTPMGPRTCLKRVDFLEDAVIDLTLQIMIGNIIKEDHIVDCLDYGLVHGFNQDRSLQFGRYNYELFDPAGNLVADSKAIEEQIDPHAAPIEIPIL